MSIVLAVRSKGLSIFLFSSLLRLLHSARLNGACNDDGGIFHSQFSPLFLAMENSQLERSVLEPSSLQF